jgi:nucleotide-binding universal stress UspA family protein
MYRSILVPLDGSQLSERALTPALAIARRMGATLHLAHVHIPPTSPIYSADLPLFDSTLDERMLEDERAYLGTVAERLRAAGDVRVEATLIDGAITESVPDLITGRALAVAADLVVMTTHGRGGIVRFWLGSVADELVRRLPMPVLLLRPDQGTQAQPVEPVLRNILVPLDGSANAEAILKDVLVLGKAMQSDLTLLRVVEPLMVARHLPTAPAVRELDDALIDQLRTDAQAYLEQVAERLAGQSLKAHVRVVVAPQAAVAILEEACHEQADLIAMATHGRHGLARLLVGSVADKVLRGATTPVLVYRPQVSKERA